MAPQGRLRRLVALSAAVLGAACALAPAAAAAPLSPHAPGEVIVRYEPDSSRAERAQARSEAGAKAIKGLGVSGMQLVRAADGDTVPELIEQLEDDPAVRYAEPNLIYRPLADPNDPHFSSLWGMLRIDAPQAWETETGDPGIVVAVMDTGADLLHSDLRDNLWTGPGGSHGYDFLANAPDAGDWHGHGTHVSGTILARGNNGIGVTGVAQRGQLMELRICGPYDEGCRAADEVAAIDFAAANGARVVNGSLGGPGFSRGVYDAIAAHPEILFVFSAGNGGDDNRGDNNEVNSRETPVYPCAFDLDNIVCVAATDQPEPDQLAGFSNYGHTSVDLAAPGSRILSTSAAKVFPLDDFESTFDWRNSGSSYWVTSREAPLTSRGITDSPGGNYPLGRTYEAIWPEFTLPQGYGTCELEYFRSIDLAPGHTFRIEASVVGSDDVAASFTFVAGPEYEIRRGSFPLVSGFDPGAKMQVRLILDTRGGTASADGVHMDEINVICFGRGSDNLYEPMSGTSMAAPHVSGAAALLFSAKPAAGVREVKAALLGSVDKAPSLVEKTVSGGRLNVRSALELLLGLRPPNSDGADGGQPQASSGAKKRGKGKPPQTRIVFGPAKVSYAKKAWKRVVFRFRSSRAGSVFLCKIDRGKFHRCRRKLVRRFGLGRHVLRVKARDAAGNVDRSPAVYRFRIKRRP